MSNSLSAKCRRIRFTSVSSEADLSRETCVLHGKRDICSDLNMDTCNVRDSQMVRWRQEVSTPAGHLTVPK
jgi:hypothetical protein